MISKLPSVGQSIFSYMSKLAADHNAINLAQGFPDFPCSPELVNLVSRHMQLGNNQYSPTFGVAKLREVIARKSLNAYGVNRNPDTEITITCGATEAIYVAITALINKGDEVIIFEPAFDSYTPVVELNGGVCKYVRLSYPDFSIDWEAVNNLVTNKTKLLIINSPHNPTGTVIGETDIDELRKIVEKHGIYVISDEVYEHIIYDGLKHFSLLEVESLREKALIISSFGKTFHTTGWRIGYCIASPSLSHEFRKVHQFSTFAATTPMQYATAQFLENGENFIHLPQFYQAKRDYFQEELKTSRFTILPCSGTYFQLVNYSEINDKRDYDFAFELTKEVGVATIPLSVFYHDRKDDQILRFCFAKKESTLKAASERLCKI
jgi:methionine transaminase